MTQKVLAFATMSLLVAFVGVLAVFVNRPNLWLVVIFGLGLAIYDFWTSSRREPQPAKEHPSRGVP